MANKKRSSMLPRADVLRGGPREAVTIPGTCQVGDRLPEEVLVTDLSAMGCRLRGNSIGVIKSEPVQLWMGDVGPVAAKLKWLKKGSLGLAFDAPLDDALLRQLHEMPVVSNVVPMRRRSAG